jgi:hypothetical protein
MIATIIILDVHPMRHEQYHTARRHTTQHVNQPLCILHVYFGNGTGFVITSQMITMFWDMYVLHIYVFFATMLNVTLPNTFLHHKYMNNCVLRVEHHEPGSILHGMYVSLSFHGRGLAPGTGSRV